MTIETQPVHDIIDDRSDRTDTRHSVPQTADDTGFPEATDEPVPTTADCRHPDEFSGMPDSHPTTQEWL